MRHLLSLVATLTIVSAATIALSQGAIQPDAARGKQVYDIFCVTCHGPLGDGKGVVGVTLQPPPRDFTIAEFKFGTADKDLFDTITNGAASKGASPLMAPWGAVIPEADRWAVIAYIRTLKK
jgi:mono/diheme cytochrome c family protein